MSDKSVVAPPWCVTTDLWCEDISCRCSEDNWYSPRWRWFKTDRRCKIPGWAAPCSWHNRTDWHTVTLTARAALWWWGALSPHPNRGFPPSTHHACTNLSYLQKQSRSKEYLHELFTHSTFSQLLPNSSAKQPVSCLSIIVNFILMHVQVPLKKLIHGEKLDVHLEVEVLDFLAFMRASFAYNSDCASPRYDGTCVPSSMSTQQQQPGGWVELVWC